jgi:hypothetical protein
MVEKVVQALQRIDGLSGASIGQVHGFGRGRGQAERSAILRKRPAYWVETVNAVLRSGQLLGTQFARRES